MTQLHRVLIIDDSKVNAMIVEDFLETYPCDLETCLNPLSAVNELQHFAPHIVILDMNMPEMSGGDLLKFLATFSDDEQPNVLVVTGDDTVKLQKLRMIYDKCELLYKPLNFEEFSPLIDKYLEEIKLNEQ